MRHKARTTTKDDWQTPPWLFKRLNDVFQFTVDCAADEHNHLCPSYFCEGNSFLEANVSLKQQDVLFCNPPFSELSKKDWAKKLALLSVSQTASVLLCPAAVETRYWQKWIFPFADEILFLNKRLCYYENGVKGGSPTFASAIVGFSTHRLLYKFKDLGYWVHNDN